MCTIALMPSLSFGTPLFIVLSAMIDTMVVE